jgi:protein TorT
MPDGTEVPSQYKPITQASKTWKIAVLFPNVFDSYWTATNYGIVQECKRDHASMQLFDAGGYANLATQVTQLDTAIAQGYDAIIIGAISATGLNAEIDKAVAKGIPVIDVINGINDPKVSGHALVSFHDLAVMTAKYIIQHSNGKPINVGFFPGPAGASWSDDAVTGFMDTIKGTNVKVVVMRRTDTAQTALLPAEQDALTTYPQINTIVGVDSAAQTGATVVRQAGKTGQVQVYAFDQIIPVWQDIVAGTVAGSPTDYTAIQGRMSVDMAIKLLQGEQLSPSNRAGPVPEMVTKANAQTLSYADMMGAKDWKIQSTVNP